MNEIRSLSKPLTMHEDRLFPADTATRTVARRLFAEVKDLPIVCPHGHTDPQWFADNERFPNPAALLIIPDHYLFRMLFSQGIALERLGVPRIDGGPVEQDPRKIWRLFAENYYLFRGTPSRMWLDHVLYEVLGIRERLDGESADRIYDHIDACLARPEYLPRALFERFNIEVIATTESALDPLVHHKKIRASGWSGRVVTAFRPDSVVDPEYEDFSSNIKELGQVTGENTATYEGYLKALKNRRRFFIEMGATSTDHGHPTAITADLSPADASALYQKAISGSITPAESETFRGQMLTEMAQMSLEDGLVMQLHFGSSRNHNAQVFAKFGRDKGADIPQAGECVEALRPLLNRFGNETNFTLILFTLDESLYSRELATLVGHYPILKVGPAWWFHDSPEGMRRYREQITETAGFYNTVGFNDDTRAFLSIPARHDVARRMDCAFLAQLVTDHRLAEDEATELAVDLAYGFVKKNYKL